MDTKEIEAVLEAILFVAGEPVELSELVRALQITRMELEEALSGMEREMDKRGRGLCLKRFGQHVQLSTKGEMAQYVEKLLQPVQKQSLSQSALETLAVVAYRQPVTRLEIEAVRGVKCDYSVQSLTQKGLIEQVGRKEVVGRPMLYGTTDKFLAHFGLGSLEDLPKPEEKALEEVEEMVP